MMCYIAAAAARNYVFVSENMLVCVVWAPVCEKDNKIKLCDRAIFCASSERTLTWETKDFLQCRVFDGVN